MGATSDRRAALVAAFRLQATGCARTGSPLYAALLERLAADLEAAGPAARVLEGVTGHPVLDALALRLLAAIHARVLDGRAPRLARYYPSAGGRFELEGAWRAVRDVLERDADALRHDLRLGVQTNEVRRCTALLGGFLHVAAQTKLALRVLEIGSSAGLNLLFDRWSYRLGEHRFGEPGSGPTLAARWAGPPPALGARLRVAARAGCDLAPVDVRDARARLRLRSFVWPDQVERLARLDEALVMAQQDPSTVERSSAAPWLARELAAPVAGLATVVFQSHVWWYLGDCERARVGAAMEAAGARARPDAPLAWLRFEGADPERSELALRTWPGGHERLLAHAHHHGAWVRWLAQPEPAAG